MQRDIEELLIAGLIDWRRCVDSHRSYGYNSVNRGPIDNCNPILLVDKYLVAVSRFLEKRSSEL